MQEQNDRYRRPKTALRRGHECRVSNTKAKIMVKQHMQAVADKAGVPGASDAFNELADQVDTACGHEQERKVAPMFRLHFLSWCIHQSREGFLSNRGFSAELQAAVKTLEADLADPPKCRTGTLFFSTLRGGVAALTKNVGLEKV